MLAVFCEFIDDAEIGVRFNFVPTERLKIYKNI